ncbi:MAG: radical SAM protein, partial [Phycisphaera sp.]|nr:radical SAM protein [Phycisphaera sp.]
MTLNSSQQADRDARIDNRLKLLAHPDRLLGIQTGDFAPPVLVDIDPVDGVCNLDCEWCCQAASRASRPTKFMSEETMRRLGPFSREWGVKSWRIAGDSEPLLNKNINTLIASGAEAGIDMGLITNGVYLERITPESLERLDWLGVSLDAGTPETWSRLKKSPAENFEPSRENIAAVLAKAPTPDVAINFLPSSAAEHPRKEPFGQ